MRALSLCSYPGPPLCTVRLLAPGRCARHKARAWRHAQPSAHARGYNAEHRRLRRIILREEPICYICGVLPSVTADHVVPLSQGGQTIRSNMRGACDPCQRRKAAREGVEARQRA